MWELIFDWPALRVLGYDAMVYVVMAFAGTLLFLIRLGFTYFGGDGSDFDLDADFDSDASFSYLSVLSILGFFMGAGWMGLACRLDWGLGRLPASLIAAGFGFAMMLAASALSFGARLLNQTIEYDMRSAVGCIATVYLPIPEKGQGTGQVQVSVSGRKKVVRAVSAGPRFEAFTEVKIIEARDDATLVAGPIT